MRFSLFIAKRLSLSKHSGSSRVIVRIAISAVAISIAVMITAIAVVKGYQFEIKNKITGFSTHIQLSRLDLNNSYQTTAIALDTNLEKSIKANSNVSYIQPFGIKAGIIKTANEFEGIVIKGINNSYDTTYLASVLQSGSLLSFSDSTASNEIMLSASVVKKLGLNIGDAVIIYFVQDPPRARRFVLKGIYKTGFEELDETYAYVDIRQIQKLNNWTADAITGYEIRLTNDKLLDLTTQEITMLLPYSIESQTIRELYPQLFEWLGLLDLNVLVIIALMIVVACINMITALLILIVERTHMIGILKTLGARNKQVQRAFLNISVYLISTGLLFGNACGLLLCFTQQRWGWFKLSQDAYYLSEVPIRIEAMDIVLLNAGSILICTIIMMLPVQFITRIKPSEAIRID